MHLRWHRPHLGAWLCGNGLDGINSQERYRVRAIVETRGGKVLRHIGDNIRVERPADVARATSAVGTGRLGFDILVSGIPLRDPLPRVLC